MMQEYEEVGGRSYWSAVAPHTYYAALDIARGATTGRWSAVQRVVAQSLPVSLGHGDTPPRTYGTPCHPTPVGRDTRPVYGPPIIDRGTALAATPLLERPTGTPVKIRGQWNTGDTWIAANLSRRTGDAIPTRERDTRPVYGPPAPDGHNHLIVSRSAPERYTRRSATIPAGTGPRRILAAGDIGRGWDNVTGRKSRYSWSRVALRVTAGAGDRAARAAADEWCDTLGTAAPATPIIRRGRPTYTGIRIPAAEIPRDDRGRPRSSPSPRWIRQFDPLDELLHCPDVADKPSLRPWLTRADGTKVPCRMDGTPMEEDETPRERATEERTAYLKACNNGTRALRTALRTAAKLDRTAAYSVLQRAIATCFDRVDRIDRAVARGTMTR